VIDVGLNQRTGAFMSQKDLQFLIDAAKKHKITEEERDAQIRSFTYGNTHLEIFHHPSRR
jgi:hypothetical protein